MDLRHQNVNFLLGSWGPQPVDRHDVAPAVPANDLLSVNDWLELAIRWADHALVEIAVGHPEMAGEYARGAYRFCLKHQHAMGKPWDRGRPDA